MRFSPPATAWLALLAVTAAVVRADVRFEELRKRRPVENAGLALLMLHGAVRAWGPAFPAIVSATGALRVDVDRRNGRRTVGNVGGKLTETDGKFARAVAAYVRSVLVKYNTIAYRYLFQRKLTILWDPDVYVTAFGTIGFRDKTDGFAVLSYLYDAGLDAEPLLDNVLLYAVPVLRPSAQESRTNERILSLYQCQLDESTGYRFDRDSDPENIAVKLQGLESELHRISSMFSRTFVQWLWNYRPEDKSKSMLNFTNANRYVFCLLWVNITNRVIRRRVFFFFFFEGL